MDDNEFDVREASSLITVRYGDRVYDAIYQRNCHTCTHPARLAIEEKVLLNFSYPAISRMYSEQEVEHEGEMVLLPRIGWDSIRSHYRNGHMPLEVAAGRKIVDEQAERLGQQLERSVERIVDARSTAQAILEKGFDRIQRGKAEPDVRETLMAAKLVAEIDERVGVAENNSEVWGEAMQQYFETARRLMPTEMWQRFTIELNKNPVLKALESKYNADETIVDAEVVNEE